MTEDSHGVLSHVPMSKFVPGDRQFLEGFSWLLVSPSTLMGRRKLTFGHGRVCPTEANQVVPLAH